MADLIDRKQLGEDIDRWHRMERPEPGYCGGQAEGLWILIRLLMLILHRLDDGRSSTPDPKVHLDHPA